MRKTVVWVSLSLTLFGASGRAGADPLRLDARSLLVFDIEGDLFRFAGSSFDLDQPGRDQSGTIVFIPRIFEISCNPCQPGDEMAIMVDTHGEVDLGQGGGVIDGMTFSSLSFRGSLAFRTLPVSFPASSGKGVFVNTPFVFTGFVRAFAGHAEVFSHALRGSGNEFAEFIRNDDSRFRLAEGPMIFQFDVTPTPEPATILMVGVGALTLARRRYLFR